MNNIFINQLKNSISSLEIKLNKTHNLKTKLEILHELNNLKSQLNDLLEAKYEAVTEAKIKDINQQINKASKRGKFMQDYFYNLEKEAFITEKDYLQFINKFWNEIISKLNPNDRIICRFLIQMSDTSARTLTKTEILINTLECLNSFKEIIIYNLNNIYSHYLTQDDENMIKGFIMRYKILTSKKDVKDTVTKKAIDIKKGRIQRTVKIRNINYPLSPDSKDFGNNIYKADGLIFVENIDKGLKFEFDKNEKSQTIKVFRNDKLINTLKDSFIDNNLFKRTVNNLAYYIKDGQTVLKTKGYNPSFISKTKLDKTFTDNIYTADIETLTKLDSSAYY